MDRMKRKMPIALFGIGCLMATASCDDSDKGLVRQNWTIDGKADPASCTAVRAAQMRIVAIDGAGVVRGTEFSPCTTFQNTVRLDPGFYSVAATFLGNDGRAVSRTIAENGFKVVDDEETVLRLDFPLSAFVGLGLP